MIKHPNASICLPLKTLIKDTVEVVVLFFQM